MAQHNKNKNQGFQLNPEMKAATYMAGTPAFKLEKIPEDAKGIRNLIKSEKGREAVKNMGYDPASAMKPAYAMGNLDNLRNERGVITPMSLINGDPNKKDLVSGNNFSGNININTEGTSTNINQSSTNPSSSSSSSSSNPSFESVFKTFKPVDGGFLNPKNNKIYKNVEEFKVDANAFNQKKNSNNNVSSSSSSTSDNFSIKNIANKKLNVQNEELLKKYNRNLRTEISAAGDSIPARDLSFNISNLTNNYRKNIISQLKPLVQSGYIKFGRGNSLESILSKTMPRMKGSSTFFDDSTIADLVSGYQANLERIKGKSPKAIMGSAYNVVGNIFYPTRSKTNQGSNNQTKKITGFSNKDILEGSGGGDYNKFVESVKFKL